MSYPTNNAIIGRISIYAVGFSSFSSCESPRKHDLGKFIIVKIYCTDHRIACSSFIAILLQVVNSPDASPLSRLFTDKLHASCFSKPSDNQ